MAVFCGSAQRIKKGPALRGCRAVIKRGSGCDTAWRVRIRDTRKQLRHVVTLMVQHVPLARPQIQPPSACMAQPMDGQPVNWAEVTKESDGQYAAEVGRETSTATVQLDQTLRKILTAELNHAAEVMRKVCTRRDLGRCGDPERYEILRMMSLALVRP